MASKRCKVCGVEKPLEDFYRSPRSRQGVVSHCRECAKKQRRAYEARCGQRLLPPFKVCGRCAVEKPSKAFHRKKGGDGLHSWCRECRNARERLARTPETNRARALRSHYGIDIATYDQMFVRQGGRCAICGSQDTGKRRCFHIDHDHETGEVRALLCNKCNPAIGLMDDDPERLEAAARYLRAFQRG